MPATTTTTETTATTDSDVVTVPEAITITPANENVDVGLGLATMSRELSTTAAATILTTDKRTGSLSSRQSEEVCVSMRRRDYSSTLGGAEIKFNSFRP